MENKFTTIQFFAGMTKNGNSRRVFVTLENGIIIATYKDNGRSYNSITNEEHRKAYSGQCFDTTSKEYAYLCNWSKVG